MAAVIRRAVIRRARSPRPTRRRAAGPRGVAALAVAALAATGCAATATAPSGASRPAGTGPAGTGPAAVAEQPRIVMTDSAHGWVVWPSGSAWAVLATDDGWRGVRNATPPAVPTTGGLRLAVRPGPHGAVTLLVAVRPTELMTVSPYLIGDGSAGGWRGGQLPAGVAGAGHAVAVTGSTVTAVLDGDPMSVVRGGDAGWRTLATAARLAPGGRLRLDGVVWASAGTGWITGHGGAGAAVAFQTDDAGRTWHPVPGAREATEALRALAPCGAGSRWLLPVLDQRQRGLTLLRTTDAGRTWSATRLPGPVDSAVLGCHAAVDWLVTAGGPGGRWYSSADSGRSWTDRGAAPAGVTDVAPTGGGTGFAVGTGSRGPVLWRVTGDGASRTPVTLPQWVSVLGGAPAD